MALRTKGGLVLFDGSRGGDENEVNDVSVRRMESSESGASQGGGIIFARRWRFKSRASHSGSCVR